MRSARVSWLTFAVCAVAVLIAMLWLSAQMVRLERAERDARTEAARQESIRLALWRLESWIAPRLALEAARPYVDYQPLRPRPQTSARRPMPLEPGTAPSPLLSFDTRYIRLHFQVAPDGEVTSPQVPTEALRDLVSDGSITVAVMRRREIELAAVRSLLDAGELMASARAAEESLLANLSPLADSTGVPPGPDPGDEAPARGDTQDWSRRQLSYLQSNYDQLAQQTLEPPQPGTRNAGHTRVGPLVPLWTSASDGTRPELLFVRRVTIEGRVALQGFLCDWPALEAEMLGVIGDLFGAATLVPISTNAARGSAEPNRLATIPARLDVGDAVSTRAVAAGPNPARSALLIAWLAVCAGLVAIAAALHSSVAFGERRSRFAIALTHELRTPLTTFRMYAEMLAEGWVQDPPQRQAYLDTLRSEADRLARVVENVLAYTRLERGRTPVALEPITLAALMDRVRPALERLTERCGMSLEIDQTATPDASLEVDSDALGQIVTNLVENACKYAAGAADRRVHVTPVVADGHLRISVRDHGPGVPRERRRAIFAAFERGAPCDTTPGVGLGLAVARGLAGRLGGDVRLEEAPPPGACFAVILPARGGAAASPLATLPRHDEDEAEAEGQAQASEA